MKVERKIGDADRRGAQSPKDFSKSPMSFCPTIFNHKHLRYPSRERANKKRQVDYKLIDMRDMGKEAGSR